jgi:hypothetical protein
MPDSMIRPIFSTMFMIRMTGGGKPVRHEGLLKMG